MLYQPFAPVIWHPGSSYVGETSTNDPLFDQTTAIFNFGGSDGSTTILEDVTSAPMTIYTPPSGAVGTPVITTSVSRSGGSALWIPGASKGCVYLDVSNPGVDLNAKSYTIEAWVRGGRNNSGASSSNVNPSMMYMLYGTSSAGNGFFCGSTTWDIRSRGQYSAGAQGTAWPGPNDNWMHIAEVGLGKLCRTFINGQLYGAVGSALSSYNFNQGGRLFFGYSNGVNPTYTSGNVNYAPWEGGYVDCARITSFPRYWHNFDPPAGPFATQRTSSGINYLPYTASQNYTGSGAVIGDYWSLTDGVRTTGARTRCISGAGWIQADLGTAQWVNGMVATSDAGTISGTTTYRPTDANSNVTFSNDGVNWLDVCSLVGTTMFGAGVAASTHQEGLHIPFPQPIFARYFRHNFYNGTPNYSVAAFVLKLYRIGDGV